MTGCSLCNDVCLTLRDGRRMLRSVEVGLDVGLVHFRSDGVAFPVKGGHGFPYPFFSSVPGGSGGGTVIFPPERPNQTLAFMVPGRTVAEASFSGSLRPEL